MTVLILGLLVGLAAANGANDVRTVSPPSATLGFTRYRTAILRAAATILLAINDHCQGSVRLSDRLDGQPCPTGLVAAAVHFMAR